MGPAAEENRPRPRAAGAPAGLGLGFGWGRGGWQPGQRSSKQQEPTKCWFEEQLDREGEGTVGALDVRLDARRARYAF